MLLTAALVTACGEEAVEDTQQPKSVESIPGVYAGVFPCDGCEGIEATLWLRTDGTFFLGQRYAATVDRDVMDVFSLGKWQAIAAGHEIELTGKGPVRTLARSSDDILDLQTGSSLPHQLLRNESLTGIDDPIRMEGNVRLGSNGAVFTECLTGLAAPVSESGDYRRFLHQLRGAGTSDRTVPVELTGRFSWANDGGPQAFIINRFETIKPDRDC